MKQIKNKYLALLLFAATALSLQSCLKNNGYYTDFSNGSPAVELPLAAKYVNKPFALVLDVSPTPTTYYAVVNLASVDLPTTPVTGKLAIDQTYLNQYNAANDAAVKKSQADYLAADPSHTVNDANYPADYDPYEVLPDSTYSISSLNVTIPAGQRLDSIPVSISSSKIAQGHKYILPLTIASASVNISNWNHLMINVTAKNKYDGLYTVKGYVYHPNAAYTGNWSDDFCGDFSLITSGGNSVDLDPGQPFSNNGSLAVFGVYPRFNVDPATNKVTVTDAAGALASVQSFPDYDSRYDPATKTFYVKYGWNGSRVAIDTLVYCGVR